MIEHFVDGYKKPLNEMKRVLKVGGYVFLTVPIMSRIRILKSKLGFYEKLENKINKDEFYQYALSKKSIINEFSKSGFELMEIQDLDGLKGLKDELEFISIFLNKIYKGKKIQHKIARKLVNILFSKISNHISLFVFKKTTL